MSKKDAVRQRAQDWFIENIECTQAEIAAMFKVTPKTVGEWAKKHNWDDKRLEYHASPVKIKQLIQQDFINVAQGNAPKINADAISKLNAVLDRLEKKADPFVVHKILKDLDNFISQGDPKFAVLCTPFHKAFLQHRINLEG